MQELLIYQGKETLIQLNPSKQHITKTLQREYSSKIELHQIKNEYNILQNVDIQGVRKVIDYQKTEEKSQIILEYVEGKNLRDFLTEESLNLVEKIEIFIKLTQIVSRIHQLGIIHKDLNPANVLITANREVYVIDFGISSKFSLKRPNLGNPEKLEGTLHYISPEQTGRMNRSVDYRTDLYALGATFYELLTGRTVFTEQEAIDLVHAHLAKIPQNPTEINQEIPTTLAQIILKLLAKNSEDRYQSAFGVAKDLEKCLAFLEKGEVLTEFTLGTEDFSGKLQIPEKLYGREKEIQAILEAFERVKGGAVELTLVAGYSGTGKSVLVSETHPSLASTKGYFVEGKFDQFQKNIPFSAWIQIFKNFVNLLLTENEETLKYWKNTILKTVGEGGVLTEVIPNLEVVIGEQPPVVALSGQEAQNRFNYVMQNFVKAITNEEYPLIIFIDDLQWADLASLNLLKTLVTDKESTHLFCIAAYRDNEVSPTHPLVSSIQEIEEKSQNINEIKIENLSIEAVLEMLAETLNLPKSDKLKKLNQNIFSKTQGNAFFTHQFLKNLYEEELLKFDFQTKTWTWENSKIQEANFTDNVVEFMTKKVENLPQKTRRLLELAACIGNKFDLETLQIIAKQKEVFKELEVTILEELIVPIKTQEYKFAHDRIQQATYLLIPQEKRQITHLKIGQLLYGSSSEDYIEKNIFSIVNHYNLAIDILKEEDRKIALKLNQIASLRAKTSASFDGTLKYIEVAQRLLPEDSWSFDYDNTLNVYKILLEAKLLNNQFEGLESEIRQVLKEVKDKIDRIDFLLILRGLKATFAKYKEAIEVTLEALSLFDIHLPDDEILMEEGQKKLEETLQKLDKENLTHQILSPPLNPSKEQNLTLFLLAQVTDIAYIRGDIPLLFYVNSMAALYALKHGTLPNSPLALIRFCLILAVSGFYQLAYDIAKITLKLAKQTDNMPSLPSINFILGCFLNHWIKPIGESYEYLTNAIQLGREAGDLQFGQYAIPMLMDNKYAAGVNLNTLKEEQIDDYLQEVLKANNIISITHTVLLIWAVQRLTNEEPIAINLLGKELNEQQCEAFCIQNELHQPLSSYYCFNIENLFMLEQYDEVFTTIQKVTPILHHSALISVFSYPNYYGSLLASKQYEQTQDPNLLETIQTNQNQMKVWAENCPENFLHKYQLVEAEKARNEGKSWYLVLELYEEAIENAKQNNFTQDVALANELCSKYLIALGKETMAEGYLRKAYQLYKHWGTTAKTTQLKEKYPDILNRRKSSSRTVTKTLASQQFHYVGDTLASTSASTTNRDLDLDTVLKANTSLSQQVRLKDLIEEMLELLSKNSGANKITFLRKQEEHWWVDADKENEQNLIKQSRVFENYTALPKQVITYVMRSKDFILLDDISQSQKFGKDPYFQERDSKSIFVIPVKKQEELLAILYLENNLNTGVFHQKRYQLVNALVTQLAISMENTLLYENLEQKVQERTLELQEAYEETQVMNEELRQTQEELQTQRDYVEERNQELKKYNQKLQSSEVILREMNDRIQHKNKELEQSNSQISLSINSAKTIQEAILPYDAKFEKYFEDYFIINRPKDVVSGDFYWIKRQLKEFREKIILVVADCTGHGVPGAFMTLIGTNLLDKIITVEGLHHPDLILEALHKEVQYFLKQKDTQNNNGMDAVVITLEKIQGTRVKLTFSGAKNNLLVYNNRELQELKGTRKSIGGIQNEEKRFENQEVILEGGDLLYLGSDGLEDQNNSKRKKFGRNRIKSIIQENYHLPLSEQKQKFEQALGQHMEGTLQRDDILWIGLQL